MKTIRLCFARTLAVCFLGISGVMSCLAPPAQADTVYTYTGNPFDVFFGVTCPPLCSLSGYIVVAAPIDFQDFRFEPVLAYSFTESKITTPVLGWLEDSVVRSDSPDFGVAEPFSTC